MIVIILLTTMEKWGSSDPEGLLPLHQPPPPHTHTLHTPPVPIPVIVMVSISSPGVPHVPSPLKVQASQSSASAPVEVSWSPPSGGAATITGYRIFYSNGENVLVTSANVTYVGLIFNENAVGQRVSIHSVAGKLMSKVINATITGKMTTCFTL